MKKYLTHHKVLLSVLCVLICIDLVLTVLSLSVKKQKTPNTTVAVPKQKIIEGQANTSTKVVKGSVNPVEAQVFITKSGFVPQVLRITKGQQVKWINQDTSVHTVTPDANLPSLSHIDALGSGESFVYTFETAGTYTFHSDGLAAKDGEIIVQ